MKHCGRNNGMVKKTEKLKVAVLAVLCVSLLLFPVSAHSSETDSNTSGGELNKYVADAFHQAAADEAAWREENKYYLEMDHEELVKEYLSMKQSFETAKAQRDSLYEQLDHKAEEEKSIRDRIVEKLTLLQSQISTYLDGYSLADLAIGIALFMGSVILLVRNIRLKRQLSALRKTNIDF